MNICRSTQAFTATLCAYVITVSVFAQTSSLPPNARNPQESKTNDTTAALIGKGLAYDIEKVVNALVDYTSTACIATVGKQSDSYSFIIISEKPIFKVEAAKKGWLLTVAGAVGKTLHDNPKFSADEVWVSDASLMKERRAFAVDASLLQSLQQRVKGDQMTLEQMYTEITRSMTEKQIPK
ncbi:MAG: hypothetical protein HY043_12225 [Verrucomicrobia bacterium]|nr:hypothetical protein [Verrucomicrobiota bacterium]